MRSTALLLLLGLGAAGAPTAPAAAGPEVGHWWQAEARHVLIRLERHTPGSADQVFFYWRAENPLVAEGNSSPEGGMVFTDKACLEKGPGLGGAWCNCDEVGDTNLARYSESPGPRSMRNHWLSRLALSTFLTHPRSVDLEVEAGVLLPAEVRYDERGLPVEAFGKSADGQRWARLTVSYRPPEKGELLPDFPWLDPGRAVELPRTEACARRHRGPDGVLRP